MGRVLRCSKEPVLHPERCGQSHRPGRKFRVWPRKELGEAVSYRTTIRFLHGKNFRLKVLQP